MVRRASASDTADGSRPPIARNRSACSSRPALRGGLRGQRPVNVEQRQAARHRRPQLLLDPRDLRGAGQAQVALGGEAGEVPRSRLAGGGAGRERGDPVGGEEAGVTGVGGRTGAAEVLLGLGAVLVQVREFGHAAILGP